MFIYTKDNVAWFDENEDLIEEYLSDWYHDNMGEDNYLGAIADAGSLPKERCVLSVRISRTRMVWTYVELNQSHELLLQHDPNY